MRKNKSPETSRRRPWRFLRLAILWAQKPGTFKQRQFFDIRLLPAYLRNLRRSAAGGDQLHCRERELSFDETPTFHFRIPCITPSVNFDDRDEMFSGRRREVKVLEGGWEESHDYEEDGEEEGEEEEEGIDLRAERFIMEFYEQMKLQRQMSYLEYDEMMHRGTRG